MKSFFPTRLAELLYAFIMGYFAVLHFSNADTMSGMIPGYIPADGKIWIYLTGAVLMVAALSILINKFKKFACYMLAIMLLVFVFTLHLKPAMDGNPGQLLKDAGLAMAAIIIGNRTSKK